MSALLGLFTSSGFGALVGLGGAWVQKREERKLLEAKFKFQLSLAERQAQVEGLRIEGQKFAAAEGSLQASYDFANPVSGWASNILSLMRPVLTLCWTAITIYMLWQLYRTPAGLPPELLQLMIFITTTATCWWFGARPGRFSAGYPAALSPPPASGSQQRPLPPSQSGK